jgi:aryl sulfotransferase
VVREAPGMTALPERRREYRSYIFDSRNWDRFVPREGDVVVSTSYKSGTTWMQNIVLNLICRDGEVPAVSDVSTWLDNCHHDLDRTLANFDGQTRPGLIKSHLPLDVIPYHPEVRYIVVVRDARDVFMSFWNHTSNYTDELYARKNDPATLIGPPQPRCPSDIHVFWEEWITRGWFDGESEGYPHSANLGHTQSWWDFRHLDNILFVHFNDLLADLTGEIARVADYLDIPVSAAECARLAQNLDFAAVKRNAARAAPMLPENAPKVFAGGLSTFFFKGTNGRWRDVLSADELAMLDRAKARVMTEDCAAFMEHGRAAL